MAYTDINSEDRLVQATFAEHLEKVLGWESVYAWNQETFGPAGTLGRASEREVVLVRDLRAALTRLNPALPETRKSMRLYITPAIFLHKPVLKLEMAVYAGDNVGFSRAGDGHTLQATKSRTRNRISPSGRCRYRIEESKG
ncbi:MAG: hypothetical protein KBD60_12240 [Sterolibacterium sp.]|jgi:hypothetical protein|nr:hypothetical protein [Sterolibacterium sp.]